MNFDRDSLLLYAVTDRAWLKGQTLAQQVEQALLGGATMVQLREKQLDLPHFRREALEIQALCRRYGVPFLINDNVDLALDIGADGVHVGQEDMEAGLVRQKLGPGKILGVSAHSPEEALPRLPGRTIWGPGPCSTRGLRATCPPCLMIPCGTSAPL